MCVMHVPEAQRSEKTPAAMMPEDLFQLTQICCGLFVWRFS